LTLGSVLLAATTTTTPPAHPDSSAPWKVEDAHGPSHTIAFDTDEGTWLSLDVSPDGKSVVFSLLGDLYVIPVSGGSARRQHREGRLRELARLVA
jgi:hypothetical protein